MSPFTKSCNLLQPLTNMQLLPSILQKNSGTREAEVTGFIKRWNLTISKWAHWYKRQGSNTLSARKEWHDAWCSEIGRKGFLYPMLSLTWRPLVNSWQTHTILLSRHPLSLLYSWILSGQLGLWPLYLTCPTSLPSVPPLGSCLALSYF